MQPGETGTGQAVRSSVAQSHTLPTGSLQGGPSSALEPLWLVVSPAGVSAYELVNAKHQQNITRDNSLRQPVASASLSQIKLLPATSNVTLALLTMFTFHPAPCCCSAEPVVPANECHLNSVEWTSYVLDMLGHVSPSQGV